MNFTPSQEESLKNHLHTAKEKYIEMAAGLRERKAPGCESVAAHFDEQAFDCSRLIQAMDEENPDNQEGTL